MGVTARGEKIRVRVGIDETRRDHLAGTVNRRSRIVGKIADRGNPWAVDDQPPTQEGSLVMRAHGPLYFMHKLAPITHLY